MVDTKKVIECCKNLIEFTELFKGADNYHMFNPKQFEKLCEGKRK